MIAKYAIEVVSWVDSVTGSYISEMLITARPGSVKAFTAVTVMLYCPNYSMAGSIVPSESGWYAIVLNLVMSVRK